VRRAIAAIDDRRGIATDTGIPWDVPADRAYFRQQTAGATILMGRATYEEMATPMPGRRNLVATSRTAPLRAGFESVPDLTAVLADPTADIWVIGGAVIYAETLPWMDALYLTRIPGDYACTKFFPPFVDGFALEQATSADGAPGVAFEVWTRPER
jgi:dihydrofolate reductase